MTYTIQVCKIEVVALYDMLCSVVDSVLIAPGVHRSMQPIAQQAHKLRHRSGNILLRYMHASNPTLRLRLSYIDLHALKAILPVYAFDETDVLALSMRDKLIKLIANNL